MKATGLFTFAATAGLVSALSISESCQSAVSGIATNTDANNCLGVSALLTAIIQPNTSIITPVDNFLKALCSAAPCSNATLSAVVANVTSGCSAEISAAGGSDTSSVTAMVEQYYPVVRQMVCLTDSGTNCITQTLTNIQSILGTLSIGNIDNVVENAFATTSVPSNLTCSNCVKEAYNVLNDAFPGAAGELTSELQSECGASFTDGATPAGIVESAKETGSKGNAALGMFMTRDALAGMGAVAAVVASSFFALLA